MFYKYDHRVLGFSFNTEQLVYVLASSPSACPTFHRQKALEQEFSVAH